MCFAVYVYSSNSFQYIFLLLYLQFCIHCLILIPAGLSVSKQIIEYISWRYISYIVVKLQILGLRLGVDFTFTVDDNDNHNDNNNNDNNNPHLNFFKGTVLGVKEQGLGIRYKG